MQLNPFAGRLFFSLLIVTFFFTACHKSNTSPQRPRNLPPDSFEITITSLTQTSAMLSWTEAKDPEGKKVTYLVTTGSDSIKMGTTRTASLSNLQENKKYDVTVTASDPDGGATQQNISFTTTEYTSPSAFDISVAKVGGTIASVTWTSSHLPDNSPVKYDVYLNEQLVKTNVSDTSRHYDFTKLNELTPYTVKIIAKSIYNKTQQSTKSFTTAQDPAPTGLTLQLGLVSYSLAKFTFGPATDAEGQSIKYSVFLDNTDISTQLGGNITPGREYVMRSLLPQKSYTLVIKATDDGNKTSTIQTTVNTLKQPTLVITNKSITPTADGFIYNLETDVDYKPSQIILYANGTAITKQPTISSIIGGNTISYTYTNAYLPSDGSFSIAANLFWGDDTEKSRTATFDSYAYYNFVPSSSVVSLANIDNTSSYKSYTIFFQNSTISGDPNYSITQVVFGTTNVGFSIFRTGDNTGYITGFANAQFAAIDAGPRTGYVIMKDSGGYHKLTFTWSYN